MVERGKPGLGLAALGFHGEAVTLRVASAHPAAAMRGCSRQGDQNRHRDWRNDVEGLGSLFAKHIPDYRNLMVSYAQHAK